MSMKRFLETLQALLTMADPHSHASRTLVRITLESTLALAETSGKCDAITLRAIMMALDNLDHLIDHRADFASRPGETQANIARRNQLKLAVVPSC